MAKSNNILSEAPAFTYFEEAPEINAAEFQKVIDSRRSVRIFDETPIPDKIIEQCLTNAVLAPNSSNLQPWEFYRIKDTKIRNDMNDACLSQIAAKTAAELFVVVARTKTWKSHAGEMIEMFNKSSNDIPKSAFAYYKKIVPFVYSQGVLNTFGYIKRILYFIKGLSGPIIREPVNKSHIKTWAVKSTALGAENLMLSLRAYGFDSCPMEGYDSKRIKKLLKLSRDAIVVMVIGAGKRKEGGIYGERVRFDSSRFIKTI